LFGGGRNDHLKKTSVGTIGDEILGFAR